MSARGVGLHPHRGFETVTILYQGEVEHHDTAGNGGLIGPGDVQWMTAAKGLLHEEMHSAVFTRQGGTFEAIQLWVNLPTQYKMIAPHYQSITDNQIPALKLDDKGSVVRVTAGNYQVEADIPEIYTTLLFSLNGSVKINNSATMNDVELAFFERSGKTITLSALKDTTLLVMNGEPIAGYGPFVMNTEQEIRQAIEDFNSGRFQ